MPALLLVAAGVAVVSAAGLGAEQEQTGLRGQLVSDHDGEAIAGGTIGLWRADTGRKVRELVADAEGRFEAPGLPDGEYTLTTEARGYLEGTSQVTAGADGGISLHLIRMGIVSGRLVTPVQGRLELIERVPDGMQARRVSMRPDSNGEFRLWEIPTGRFDLVLVDPVISLQLRRGVQSLLDVAATGFLINGGEEFENVDLAPALQTGYRVSVTLAPVDRELRGSLFARLVPIARPVLSLPMRRTGNALVWTMQDVLPGEYEVRAQENVEGIGPVGELRGTARISVSAADVSVDVPMTVFAGDAEATTRPESGSIAAEIDPDAAPDLAVVIVMDVTAGRSAPVRAAFARPGTTVVFDDLPPGRYYIAARDGSAADERWAPPPGRDPPAAEVLSGVQTLVRLTWQD